MKKLNISIIIMAFLFLATGMLSAQTREEKDLQRKYDIYRARFNKHFIVQDRTAKGCINDGIGMILAQDSSQCRFTKEGYGIPATNLWIAPNGAGAVGRRANFRLDHDCNNFGISWFGEHKLPRENPKHRFNWLDFGSETLTQSGWMFVMLATEYEIYRRKGNKAKQQEALEEIFLGLQAIRRLDMHTQHLLDRTYAKRAIGQELICRDELVEATNLGFWNNCHRNWDARVKKGADFIPNFSGYTGFMLRSDAGQNLEDILHDPEQESWNVDMIGGAFGGLNSVPLSACEPIDSLCYLANEQLFISHDQIINLFYGFLFIKKYIPEDASVTTCKGGHYRPVSIMKKIANALVEQIRGNHIVLPGSKEMCGQWVKLSECEGGDLTTTIYGIKKVNDVLQNQKTKTTFFQKMMYRTMSSSNSKFNGDFYYKIIAGYQDFSFLSKKKQRRILKINKIIKKEILLIGNDLLFPEGVSMADKIGGADFFKKFLLSAPLDGPCHANDRDMNKWPYGGGDDYWPNDFSCDNIINWETNRWSSNDWGKDGHIKNWTPPVRSNGLDYMALYNIYLLQYGSLH